MTWLRQFLRRWGSLIGATFGAGAVLAAPLSSLLAADLPPPFMPRFVAVWLGFTLLIGVVLAAGIGRMTYANDGGENDISPWHALGAMVAIIAICGLSVVPVVVFGLSDIKYLLFVFLAIAVAVALFIVRPRLRGNKNPSDNAST